MCRCLFLATVVAGLSAGSSVRHSSVVHAQTTQGVPEPCCGQIAANGQRLAQTIDSLHVEDKWLAHEHINWKTGDPDRPAGYDGPGKATHCSAFVAALGDRLNVYMLRPPDHSQILLASAQAEWFHDKGGESSGWKPLGGPDHEQTAQELANQGVLVVIVYESLNPHTPGHIVVVRPSEKSAERLRREGPQIAQAGTINYSSYVAAQAFIHHAGAWPDGVRYYWHKVDWASIPAQ